MPWTNRRYEIFSIFTLLLVAINLISYLFGYFGYCNERIRFLWLLGALFDITSLLIVVINRIRGGNKSGLPGIGWIFYLISCAFYPYPLFLGHGHLDIYIVFIYKTLEFILLTAFHYITQLALPSILCKNKV